MNCARNGRVLIIDGNQEPGWWAKRAECWLDYALGNLLIILAFMAPLNLWDYARGGVSFWAAVSRTFLDGGQIWFFVSGNAAIYLWLKGRGR